MLSWFCYMLELRSENSVFDDTYVECAGWGGAVLGASGRGGPGVVRGGFFLKAGACLGDILLPICAAEAEAFRTAIGAGAPQACGHLLDQAVEL